jgi:hypothetical protein
MPLGPRDYYRPWYGHSNVYVNNVNNVTFVNNGRPVRPQQQPQAGPVGHRPGATVVLQDQFAGRPIGNSALRVSGEAVASAPVLAGNAVLPPRVASARPLRVQPANAAAPATGQGVPARPVVAGQPAYPQGTAAQPAASATQPGSKPVRVAPQAGAAAAAPATQATTPASPNYSKPARATRDERQVQQGEAVRAEKPVSNRELSRSQVRQAPQQQQVPVPVQQQGQVPVQQQHVQPGAPVAVQPHAEKAPVKPKPQPVEAEADPKPSGGRQAR